MNHYNKNVQTEIKQLLVELIKIESHQEKDGYEQDLVKFIKSYFVSKGIEVELQEVQDGRCNIIAKIKNQSDGPTILFNGHTDTVPPYNMKNPFNPVEKDGKIYGRGSVDMKGALATMMVVVANLKQGYKHLKGNVLFAGTIGEEDYSPGANYLRKSNIKADYIIVGEPTELEIGIAHKGVVWGQAVFSGVAVHGSVPEQGINAIYNATKWINTIISDYIPSLKRKSHPLLGYPSINIGQIKGGTRPVIVPDKCVVNFERRMLPGEKEEEILEELQQTINSLTEHDPNLIGNITQMPVFHGVPHRALATDSESKIVKTMINIYEDLFSKATKPRGLSFWTDAALLQDIEGAEVVVCGPGNIKQAHSNNEYISLDQLQKAYEMYLETALKLCGEGDNH